MESSPESAMNSPFFEELDKKDTVIAEPRLIGTPDTHLATFKVPNQTHRNPDTSLDRPTMPTETDTYDIDLTCNAHSSPQAGADKFLYEAQIHKTLFVQR
jgi:hypothetical protein